MMKYIFLVVIFLIPFVGLCEGKQKGKKTGEKQRIYMDALIGCSVPMGFYAKTDKSAEKSGYAGTGIIVQANADWLGKKEFGVAFQYNFQYNPFKNAAKYTIPYGRQDSLGTGSWSNHYILLGPVYLKQMNKIIIDIKVLTGLILSSSALFTTTDPATKVKSRNVGMNLGFGLKAGVGYFISKNFALMLNLSYLGGNPKIDKQYEAQLIGIDPKTGDYIYSAPVEIQTKIPVSTFNVCAGILFKL